MTYQERIYRQKIHTEGLVSFSVLVKETDLLITASQILEADALSAVLEARFQIEEYIKKLPEFQWSLAPLAEDPHAPDIIRKMLRSSSIAGVGPMAAVAGAVAEHVGSELLKQCTEVIVENGGDIFLKISREVTVGIFAGESSLSNRIGLKIAPRNDPMGICTSSGTVGHSLSFGNADAVTIVSPSPSLADAAATKIGNMINNYTDIQKAIDAGRQIPHVEGILIIKDDHLGVWGTINLVSLN